MFKICVAVLKSYDEVISMQTHAPDMLSCGAHVGNEGLNLVYAQVAHNDVGPGWFMMVQLVNLVKKPHWKLKSK